jgi:hypothetical protein
VAGQHQDVSGHQTHLDQAIGQSRKKEGDRTHCWCNIFCLVSMVQQSPINPIGYCVEFIANCLSKLAHTLIMPSISFLMLVFRDDFPIERLQHWGEAKLNQIEVTTKILLQWFHVCFKALWQPVSQQCQGAYSLAIFAFSGCYTSSWKLMGKEMINQLIMLAIFSQDMDFGCHFWNTLGITNSGIPSVSKF